MPDIQFAQSRLLAIIKHLGGCHRCQEEHGENPESVSCYCRCHSGYADRWNDLKRDAAIASLMAD